jgi:hypothetical protein
MMPRISFGPGVVHDGGFLAAVLQVELRVGHEDERVLVRALRLDAGVLDLLLLAVALLGAAVVPPLQKSSISVPSGRMKTPSSTISSTRSAKGAGAGTRPRALQVVAGGRHHGQVLDREVHDLRSLLHHVLGLGASSSSASGSSIPSSLTSSPSICSMIGLRRTSFVTRRSSSSSRS